MAEKLESGSDVVKTKQSSRVLVAVGLPTVLFTAIFMGRMVWEETFLTFQQEPQMLGYSLAHGAGAILLLAPWLLSLWLLVALVILIVCPWRKRSLSKWYLSTFASAVLILGILSLPPAFWQFAFLGSFARSPHAGDLMVYAAGEGDARLVRGYLDHGVSLEATNYAGSTAAFVAAAAGDLPMIEMLASEGASLNATNAFGDSPLEAASENGHPSVAAFLRTHGASQNHGSLEQRATAWDSIVRKGIERDKAR